MKFLYLLIDISALLVPFIFSFHPKINFYKEFRAAFPAIIISAAIFIVWDIYYTYLGVWGFNPNYFLGPMLLNLPIEEVLFFICIPYSCLFTYFCFSVFINKNIFLKAEKWITVVLILLLIFGMLISEIKLYTYYTFASLLALILFLKFILHVNWLHRFYFSYLILIIPFLFINGLLTGTGLNAPIVWYNNYENLGIRILTIPIEDFFYGCLLILLNVSIFEFLNKKNSLPD